MDQLEWQRDDRLFGMKFPMDEMMLFQQRNQIRTTVLLEVISTAYLGILQISLVHRFL